MPYGSLPSEFVSDLISNPVSRVVASGSGLLVSNVTGQPHDLEASISRLTPPFTGIKDATPQESISLKGSVIPTSTIPVNNPKVVTNKNCSTYRGKERMKQRKGFSPGSSLPARD